MGASYDQFGLNTMLPLNQNLFTNTQFSFLVSLELPYFSKLTNDPIFHNIAWPPILVKIPINIPKFNGKKGEDPTSHITTYHLWCVSKSMLDDSIRLRLFPCNLACNLAKWFINLPTCRFSDFNSLEITLLTHFQLLI